MTEISGSLEPAEFLRHAGFVRALALRLARDEAAAEDLVQETWLAAWRNPAVALGGAGRVRSWLARVLWNQAALGRRTSARRARREEHAARNEAVPDTTELLERLELHRCVVEAALALPPDYRDVIVRRYARDETPKAIAAQLGLPESTVRTRLRRGLERLRERLRPEFGGSRGLFLAGLARLGSDPGPAATVSTGSFAPASSAPGIPGGTLALPILVMKKSLVLGALALLALGVAWSVRRAWMDPAAGPTGERAVAARAPAALTEPLVPEQPATAAPGPVEERVAVPAATLVGAESAGVDLGQPVDPPERGTIRVRVEDERGNRIPLADVDMTVLRARVTPATSYGWFPEPSRGVTGPDGEVELWYPSRVHDADEGYLDTGFVGFVVSHPDYATQRNWKFDVADELAVVVLERGAFLVVSGWVDDREARIRDVTPLLDDRVDVTDAEWLTIADGRKSCGKVPPGVHALTLRWDGPDGPYHSQVVEFTLEPGEHEELHLELFGPRSLFGVLAPEVPRPVSEGEAWLNLYHHDEERDLRLFRRFETPIEPDGSFTFANLPPGTGEVIALCAGWSSAFVMDPAEPQAEPGLLQVDPSGTSAAEPWVLRMEPTVRVEFTVLDPDGEPLAGAVVSSWPNVHWTMGYSQIFLERGWNARTDRFGHAVLENLPALDGTPYGIVHASYRMPVRENPFGQRRRDGWLELRSAEALEELVRMDLRDD